MLIKYNDSSKVVEKAGKNLTKDLWRDSSAGTYCYLVIRRIKAEADTNYGIIN